MNTTVWRSQLYTALAQIPMTGEVIDLGGSKNSGYHELIPGKPSIKVVNMDTKCTPDFFLDLEQPLTDIPDAAYDGVLCINTLEHIYHFQQLLDESMRILKPGGSIVIAVPFIMPVHPSPHDFWRFTGETLEKVLGETGFSDVKVTPIGRGPFTAGAHVRFNAYKLGVIRASAYAFARVCDAGVKLLSKKNLVELYPLGYLAIAHKN